MSANGQRFCKNLVKHLVRREGWQLRAECARLALLGGTDEGVRPYTNKISLFSLPSFLSDVVLGNPSMRVPPQKGSRQIAPRVRHGKQAAFH
jgi:hypothetical protein